VTSKAPVELEAILVGQSDYRESDRIVKLLCAEHGLISAVARSARASRRRFGGSLDPGNRLAAILKRGRGELWHLQEVTLLDGRTHSRSDLDRLTLLVYACEAIAALARRDYAEPQLFGLLQVACLLIDAAPTPPGALFRMALEAKALTFAGLTPGLVRCVDCTEPLRSGGPWTFDPTRGGALHHRCDRNGGRPISLRWLNTIEGGRRTPLKDLTAATAPPGPAWLLAEIIEAHTEQPLRSRSVLVSLNPYG
jgi:DNA repair protein RecO (recombination protein O)